MPHDMIAAEIAEARAPAPRSPGHQRLALLAEALRHQLPERFKWNFATTYVREACGTTGCALGLAATMWPELRSRWATLRQEDIAELFGMGTPHLRALFLQSTIYLGPPPEGISSVERAARWARVTPADVAAAIEHYLATGKLPAPAAA